MTRRLSEGKATPPPVGCALAILGTVAATWGALSVLGYDLHRATAARVPSSPYLPGQFRWYVVLPATMTLLALLGMVAVRRWRRLATLLGVGGFVAAFLLLPYLLSYTGGV